MTPALKIASWHIDRVLPYAKNARLHSDEQVGAIARSITEYGFINPCLVDDAGVLIAGHGRVLAAKALGREQIPVIKLGHLTEEQARALRIVDNALPLAATWDKALIAGEIGSLKLAGYDIGLLGFPEVQLRAWGISSGAAPQDPELTPESPKNPVSRRGDIWTLGPHRLMCGDSCDIADVRMLTDGVVPELANCDPPYGINVVKTVKKGGIETGQGKVGGGKPHPFKGKVKGAWNRQVIAPGMYYPVIGDDSIETAVKSYQVLKTIGVPIVVMWGGNYFANALPPSRCWLVWDKENIASFADAELAWTNQDAVVRLLRHQWSGLIKASERSQRRVHPTQKPVAISEWVIDTMAPKAKKAIDLFMGSGAMLIACERKGIACYGVEMAEPYCDVIVARWEKFTSQKATLDGVPFDEVAEARRTGRPRGRRRSAK